MDSFYTCEIRLAPGLAVPCLIRALVVTEYLQVNPLSGTDLVSCGGKASAFDYCACRVDGNTCELLTTSWCKNMSVEHNVSYLIKREITETLQSSVTFEYERILPIYVRPSSGIKLMFTLRSGWWGFTINLLDEQTNIVLHVNLRKQDVLVLNAYHNGMWGTEESKLGYGRYTMIDVQRTMEILSDNDKFLIYLDGNHEMTFNERPHLPAASVHRIKVDFGDIQGNLHEITYRAGHLPDSE